jgi:hypothetical protein
VGELSFTTVSVPSPCELKTSIVAGLKVAPSPNASGQIRDDVPVRSRQNDHVIVFVARSEKDIVLRVQRKAAASSALAREVVSANHLHRVRVDDRDGRFVCDVDIDLAVPVSGCLLGWDPSRSG